MPTSAAMLWSSQVREAASLPQPHGGNQENAGDPRCPQLCHSAQPLRVHPAFYRNDQTAASAFWAECPASGHRPQLSNCNQIHAATPPRGAAPASPAVRNRAQSSHSVAKDGESCPPTHSTSSSAAPSAATRRLAAAALACRRHGPAAGGYAGPGLLGNGADTVAGTRSSGRSQQRAPKDPTVPVSVFQNAPDGLLMAARACGPAAYDAGGWLSRRSSRRLKFAATITRPASRRQVRPGLYLTLPFRT